MEGHIETSSELVQYRDKARQIRKDIIKSFNFSEFLEHYKDHDKWLKRQVDYQFNQELEPEKVLLLQSDLAINWDSKDYYNEVKNEYLEVLLNPARPNSENVKDLFNLTGSAVDTINLINLKINSVDDLRKIPVNILEFIQQDKYNHISDYIPSHPELKSYIELAYKIKEHGRNHKISESSSGKAIVKAQQALLKIESNNQVTIGTMFIFWILGMSELTKQKSLQKCNEFLYTSQCYYDFADFKLRYYGPISDIIASVNQKGFKYGDKTLKQHSKQMDKAEIQLLVNSFADYDRCIDVLEANDKLSNLDNLFRKNKFDMVVRSHEAYESVTLTIPDYEDTDSKGKGLFGFFRKK